MSAFTGAGTGPLQAFLPVTDDRIALLNYQWVRLCPRQAQSPWQDGQLWSRSGGLGGQFSSFGMVGDDLSLASAKWELYGIDSVGVAAWSTDDTGGAKQNVLVGQTLDQYGNPLGNCVVQLFLTSNDQIIAQITSDTAGYYRIPTPYSTSTAHYLVCYLAGPPDVAGTSVNTLTPTATG